MLAFNYSKLSSFALAAVTSFSTCTIAVSTAGLFMLALPQSAHAGKGGGTVASAKPISRATSPIGTAGIIRCNGPLCPGQPKGKPKKDPGPVVTPIPIVRDHRQGGGGGGGVTVTDGPPRPPGPLCAGWFC